MSEIARLLDRLARNEGVNETGLAGVRVSRKSTPLPPHPLIYQQGIIIVGQGHKRVHMGGKVFDYDPDHYLVLSVPIPAECEVSLSEGEPLLAMAVDIDMAVLNEIIGQMEARKDCCLGCKHQGLFLARADDAFKDTVARLLRALCSPVETRVLGPGLVRELLFRVMCGENAASLHALAMKNTSLSRIDKALKQIHDSFDQPLSVEQLAACVNMSASTFHRAFKDVTSFSPIQYLKKVRLNKARALLAEDGLRAKEVARMVGYESVSQFSREFKRYYGASPANLAGMS